jgi:outer membrane usher protein FimD/PapC
LVFFGPRGEKREEVRRISVGDGRLAKGDFRYSIAAAQRDTSLFEVRDKTRDAQRDVGAWESSVQIDYGLSPYLTLSSGVQQFERFGEQAVMGLVGLRTSVNGVAVKLDFASQSPGGSAVALGIGGRAFGITYGVNHSEYSGEFLDEVRRFGDGFYTRQTEAQLGFDVPIGKLKLPIQLRALRSVFVDGRTDSQASVRTGWSLANLLWSNTLDYQGSTGAFVDQDQLRGSLTVATTRAGNGQFRAGLDYDFLPSFDLTSFTLNYDRDFKDDLRARFQVSQDLRGSSTRLGASVSRLFKTFELALDSFYDTKTSDYTLGVRLGFSLGRNPQNGAFVQRRLGLAQGGAVAARVFKDLNGNGVFDASDLPVTDARVVSSGTGSGITDANGIAFIPNVGENRRTSISLDETTLDSIYLQSPKGKFEILPRAGRVHVTNIPLIETGEIEGVVRFIDRNGSRPVSAVGFNIIDMSGKIVARVRSEADGYFIVESIALGSYTIELDPDQAARLNIKLVAPVTFAIRGEAESAGRVAIEVQRR